MSPISSHSLARLQRTSRFSFSSQSYPSFSSPSVSTVVTSYSVERFHHDHRVAADDTHAESDLVAVCFAFGGFIEDDVQEDLRVAISLD